MCESINKIFFVFFYSIIFISCDNNDKKYNSWTTYGGDPSGSKYSSLDEINVRNVNSLKLLWTYEAFDKNEKHKNGIQCNPIVIDDRIYLIGPDFNVHSINAENGGTVVPITRSTDRLTLNKLKKIARLKVKKFKALNKK